MNMAEQAGMKLEGKTILVTGTSPNIGGGIVEALAAAGAAIVAVDANGANAEAAATFVGSQGGQAIGIACDVSSEAEVAAAVARGLERFGAIDGLVNNAAFFQRGSAISMPLDNWRRQLAVILDGAFLFTKHVGQAMIDRGKGGAMVNIISTAGHQGEPNNIAYTTSKAGLLNFTRAVAMELAEHGIRVNSLTPTATDPAESVERGTRWNLPVTLPGDVAEIMAPFEAGIPLGRLPRPSDYGGAAAFLLSDEAGMITGTDLRVDAGAVARYWAWLPQRTAGARG